MLQNTSLHTTLDAEMDKILGCIHCGLCLPACPTYQQAGNENDSPRGRIYLMRAVAEDRLDVAAPAFARHIDLCLGCRACETACPAGVNYGHLLEAARETINEHGAKKGFNTGGFQKRMLGLALRHVFPYPKRLAKVFALSRRLRENSLIRFAYHKGIIRTFSRKADFALSLLMATAPAFRTQTARNQTEGGSRPASSSPEHVSTMEPAKALRPVAVFTGCVMEGLFKHANDATRRVLEVNHCQSIEVAKQVCCGALHAHSGDLETARKLARQNIDAFERFLLSGHNSGNPATILINAAGCGALLKEYGPLLKDDPLYAARAEAFSQHVKDVTEYLAKGEIRSGAEVNESVTLDAPCHLYHAQRVMTAPQTVLAAIPGLEYRQLEGMQDCCGGAGIYNLSEPEMSEAILSDKISKVKATGAKILATANPGCHMQLGAGARMFKADCQVVHVVELLDESYRKAGFYQSDLRRSIEAGVADSEVRDRFGVNS
ncbi:MAG: heterodisulfide reductase-related iron-sulfur binding cluster [Acidobacteriota bacterium]|nr:heterodisulfide reductase-related iron-sulfur binding cluster [Acidobacteriota bacterium]